MPSVPGDRMATEEIFGIAVETVVVVVVEVVVVVVAATVVAVVAVATVVVVVTGATTCVVVATLDIRIHVSFRFTRPQTILTSETLMTLPAFEHRALCLPVASTTDDDPTNRQANTRLNKPFFPMRLLYLSGFANHYTPELSLAGVEPEAISAAVPANTGLWETQRIIRSTVHNFRPSCDRCKHTQKLDNLVCGNVAS